MPNWKTPETRDRLMAAVVASLDQKSLNYNRIAQLFGQGTTYHAIEGQFRQVRKDAQQLKDDLENGVTETAISSASASRSSNGGSGGARRKAESSSNGASKRPKTSKNDGKNASPSTKRDTVLTGRVTKSKSITPTNANAGNGKSNGHFNGYENNNTVRGFKEELESSETSASNTPLNPLDFPLSSDGINDMDTPSFDGANDIPTLPLNIDDIHMQSLLSYDPIFGVPYVNDEFEQIDEA